MRCARAKRDDMLNPEIKRAWQANMQVYGADKVWRQLKREDHHVARCTVERLMKRQGLQGVRRGKIVRTTITDAAAPCPNPDECLKRDQQVDLLEAWNLEKN